jgi:hypothetical protein
MTTATIIIRTSKAQRKLLKASAFAQKSMQSALKKSTLWTVAEVKASINGQRSEPQSVDTGLFKALVLYKYGTYGSVVYSNLPYAVFLEYGTSPHFVAPVRAQALHWSEGWMGGGKQYFSKGHVVGGIRPRRHFRNTAIRVRPVIKQIYREAFVGISNVRG